MPPVNVLNLSDRQKGLSAAILTASCWSFLAIFLKFALKYSDSYSIVWYRMFIAFVTLLIWFFYKKQTAQLKVLTLKPGTLLLAALALAFNYVGFMQGVHYTSPANAQIFIQVGPLLLAISGLFIFKEKLSKKQLLGFALCLTGFGLFFLDRMQMVQGDPSKFLIGLSWVISGAITWALFASLQKSLLNFWRSSQINVYVYMISSLLFIPFVNWQGLLELPLTIHLFYIFLGLNTLLAYGSLSVALKYLPATQVSPIITMNPLFTLVLINIIAWMEWTFIPADPISLQGYIGAICAITGVIFVLSTKKHSKN